MTAHTTILATSTGPYVFWITSRGAGIAALILSSLSVSLGLLMAGGRGRTRRADMRVAHEALALSTLAALVIHGLSLLGDGYLHPSLADVAIPFAGSYRTVWTAAGIIAFWSLAILGLSYYLRAKIGAQRWRSLHRLTAVAWILGIVHSLGDGTDAGQTWFLAMTATVVAPAVLLLLIRHLRPAGLRGAPAQPLPRHTGRGVGAPASEMQGAGSR